jgi:para-nitrobenzyl esterase
MIACLCHAVVAQGPWSPKADISLGVMTGTLTTSAGGNSVENFLGIPYAQQPIGDLRFASPVDYTEKFPNGKFDAQSMGNYCLQAPVFPSTTFSGDEACLNVNVWRPAGTKAGAKLPVQFYIHGGAFVIGSNSYPTYNGGNIAGDHASIVISTNYRLGALGWMAFPRQGENATVGPLAEANFGMQDQASALRWANAHVEALGGDKSKIQIFGQSAGGISVMNHMVSPQVMRLQ